MNNNNNNQKSKRSPDALISRITRILANTRKEIKILWNDRLAMFILFILPLAVVFSIYFSEAETGDIFARMQTPVIGILDEDSSVGYYNADLSEEFVKKFKEYEQKDELILYENYTKLQLEEKLGMGELHAYITIPEGFEFNISIHFVGYFNLVIDSYSQLVLRDVQSLIEEITQDFSEDFNFTGAIDQKIEYINVPQTATQLFQVSPLFFPMIIFGLTSLINSQSIVGDIPKDRMELTPTSKFEILMGKLFGSIVINSSMVLILWGLSVGLGIKIRGSLFIYFFILWLCSLVGISVGLFISSMANTQLAAFQIFVLAFISQVILILFIENKSILMLFPIWTTMRLIIEVSLQGINLLESGYLIPFVFTQLIEFFVSLIGASILYKFRRSLI